MANIILNDFQGVNYREENIPKNVSPHAINVDTSKGLIAKRKGYSSLFNSLGSYPTKGVVSHLDDMLYFEGNGSIYRASGEATINDSPESVEKSSGVITDASYFSYSVPLMKKNGDTFNLSGLEASSLSSDGTMLFVLKADDFIRSYTLSTPFDFSTATYNDDALDMSGIDDDFRSPKGIYVSHDGSYLFIVAQYYIFSSYRPKIYRLYMSTPFDLSTAISSGGLSYSALSIYRHYKPYDLKFSSDGKHLIIIVEDSDDSGLHILYSYDTDTPFSVSGSDYYNQQSKTINSNKMYLYNSNQSGTWVSDDGKRLLVTLKCREYIESDGTESERFVMLEYYMSTPFDVSSISDTTQIIKVFDNETEISSIDFDSTGRRMFLTMASDEFTIYAYEQDLDIYESPEYAIIPYKQRENFSVNEKFWNVSMARMENSWGASWDVTYNDTSVALYQFAETGSNYNVYQKLTANRNVDLTYVDSIEVTINLNISDYSGQPFYAHVYVNGEEKATLSSTDGSTVTDSFEIDTTGYTGMCLIDLSARYSYIEDDRDVAGTATFSNLILNYSGNLSGEYVVLEYDITDIPIFAKALFDYINANSSLALSYAESPNGSDYSSYENFVYGENITPEERYIKIRYDIAYSSSVGIIAPMLSGLSDPKISYSLSYEPTEIKSGFSGKLRGTGAGNYVYLTAGGRPFKDDGVNTTYLGIEAPTTVPTLEEGAAGDPSGTYKGVITFVNEDGVESDRSSSSAELTVSSKQIDWIVPTGGGDTVSRRLYRTVDGGDVYYLITEINDNITTSYIDNNADLSIQNSDNIVSDLGTNGVPPDCTIIWEHGNHLFYVSANNARRLYFSKVYGVDSDAPYAAYEQVPENYYYEFSYPITGLRTFAGYLIVTGKYFTSLISGTIFGGTSDNTTIKQLDNLGADVHEGMAVAEGSSGKMLALLTRHGISYLATGQYDTDLSRSPLSYPISSKLQGGDLSNSFLFYFRDFLYAGFINSAKERVMYRYDFYRNTWDGPWSLDIFSMTEFHLGIVGGGMEQIALYTMFEGNSDDGTGIEMIYDTRFSGSGENITIKKGYVYANNITGTNNLTFSIQGDSDVKLLNIGTGWSEPNASLIGAQKEKLRALGTLRMQGDRFGVRISDDSTNPVEIKKIVLYY